MERKWYRDTGLQFRMFFTMFLLAVVYLAFLAFLFSVNVPAQGIVFFVGIFLVAQYYFSDKLALWSMGAKIVDESEEPRLHETVARLCAIAGLPKPRIAVVESNIPNAFATGRSQGNAVVAVTTSLVRRLDQGELEAVLAHELSHVKNQDVLVMTIASFLSTVAFFLARNLLFFGIGGRRRDSGGLLAVWVVSILVWIASFLLIRALSRYREFAADRGSAIITGRPSNLASALLKISGVMERVPSNDLREVEGMNAFFIMPAISKSSFMALFSTHPKLEQRLAALERLEQSMEF